LNAPTTLRVLSHLGGAAAVGVPDDLADHVDVIPVSLKGPPPADASGEVLVTIPGWGENTDELLSRGVRWLHFIATGVDGVRFDELPDGLLITNSRGASAIPISEWVLAMMLAFEKRLPDTWIDAPPANWRADPGLGTLYRKRLAIVGFGSIGAAVAERARPFGMTTRALRRTSAPLGVDGVERVERLDDALADADHIVVAAPLTAATHHMVDAEAFALMKPGVHLVNIARGGLIDQDALRVALDDGTVALASLDAVDPEPLPAGHWMFEHPRVRLSPHDSWSWPRAYDVMLERFIANLRAYVEGRPLPDLVDPAVGY
jgi:phosphoglycerate dehydrogenase-like enzyme